MIQFKIIIETKQKKTKIVMKLKERYEFRYLNLYHH